MQMFICGIMLVRIKQASKQTLPDLIWDGGFFLRAGLINFEGNRQDGSKTVRR